MRSISSALLASVVVAGLTTVGCGPGPQARLPGPTYEQLSQQKPRVLWIAAHPDDESLTGGILARSCIRDGARCHFFVFNRGRGGECCIPEGCHPDLGTVRHRELVKAARTYHATLEHYDFFNASLPVESFPTRTELEARWLSEGDPVGLVARTIRRYQPQIILTLDPYRGTTGHIEHQASARFAIAGIRMAADPKATDPLLQGLAPYKVRYLYQVNNKYPIMKLVGNAYDPKPYNEVVDTAVTCELDSKGHPKKCRDIAMDATRVHRSQDNDMGHVRGGRKYWNETYLRRVDPFGPEATSLIRELDEIRAKQGSSPKQGGER